MKNTTTAAEQLTSRFVTEATDRDLYRNRAVAEHAYDVEHLVAAWTHQSERFDKWNGYGPKFADGARSMAMAFEVEMIERGFMAARPAPVAVAIAPKGKVMAARFAGRCADCGEAIAKGESIRFDGKAHHVSH